MPVWTYPHCNPPPPEAVSGSPLAPGFYESSALQGSAWDSLSLWVCPTGDHFQRVSDSFLQLAPALWCDVPCGAKQREHIHKIKIMKSNGTHKSLACCLSCREQLRSRIIAAPSHSISFQRPFSRRRDSCFLNRRGRNLKKLKDRV